MIRHRRLIVMVGAAWLLMLASSRTGRTEAEPRQPLEARTLEHGWQVLSVAYSPDGRLLASGSADLTAKLWDARPGSLKRTLPKEC